MSEFSAAQLRQGRNFVRMGDLPRAIEALERARVLTGDDVQQQAEILEALSDAYGRSGQAAQAAITREQLARLPRPARPAPTTSSSDAITKRGRAAQPAQLPVSEPSGTRSYLIGGIVCLVAIVALLVVVMRRGGRATSVVVDGDSPPPAVKNAMVAVVPAATHPASAPATIPAVTVAAPPPRTIPPPRVIPVARIAPATRPAPPDTLPVAIVSGNLPSGSEPLAHPIVATRPILPPVPPVAVIPIAPKPDRQQLLKDTVGLCMVVVRYAGPSKDGDVKIDLPLGSGTAFAVSSGGLMLTNRHVVEISDEEKLPENLAKAKMPNVTFRGVSFIICFGPEPKDRYVAKLIHRSENYDMAILKINHHFSYPLTVASTPPRQGDDILVCGFPAMVMEALNDASHTHAKVIDLTEKWKKSRQVGAFDGFAEDSFDSTLTKGIVSAPSRSVDGARYVQIDAAISPGNSGGPVLNFANEVIGIATWALRSPTTRDAGTNYNFALGVGQLADELEPYLHH